MIDAVKTCFRKFATFSGRASRSEFWYFVLFLLLVHIVLIVVNSALFGPELSQDYTVRINAAGEQSTRITNRASYTGGAAGNVFALLTLIPWIAVGWRRLHDIGRRGLWLFLPWGVGAVVLGVVLATSQQVPFDSSGLPESFQAIESVPVPQSTALVLFSFLALLISFVTVVVWLARRSEPQTNAYGPVPNAEVEGESP